MKNNTEKTIEKSDEKKQNKHKQEISEIQEKQKEENQIKNEEKISETKKPEIQNKKIIKKTEAVVNIQNAPVSTKFSMAICKFIKHKEIEKAVGELEQVLAYKKAVPMKGGVGHKRTAGGFASGSGKYPMNTAKYFITLLKSLSANASANGLEAPVITEAFANIGQKPRARFGRWQRKRTHIKLVAMEKRENKKIKNKDKEKKIKK